VFSAALFGKTTVSATRLSMTRVLNDNIVKLLAISMENATVDPELLDNLTPF
jgi:hypothetical protein